MIAPLVDELAVAFGDKIRAVSTFDTVNKLLTFI